MLDYLGSLRAVRFGGKGSDKNRRQSNLSTADFAITFSSRAGNARRACRRAMKTAANNTPTTAIAADPGTEFMIADIAAVVPEPFGIRGSVAGSSVTVKASPR